MPPSSLTRRCRYTAAAAVLALLLAPPIAAQSHALPPQGSLIRVRTAAAPERWITGTLGAKTSEVFWLGERVLQLESITRLEVSDGRKSQFGKGLRVGAIAGASMGLLVLLGSASVDDGSFEGGVGVSLAALSLPFLTVFGAATGGFVGALSETDRWQPIATDRVRLSVVPTARGGLGLGVGVTF